MSEQEKQDNRRTRRHKPGNVRFALAQQGRTGPRLGGMGLSINEELRRDLGAIKQQSRRAGNDDGYVVKFLSMCETHVVGPEGFSFQSKVKLPDGTDDKRANALIESHFAEWGKKGMCDVTGRYSWQDIQTLFIRSVAEDGELLVRFVEGFPNRYGFALQLLDSAHLDINYNRELKNGHRVRMGVELDEWDRPTAYHILTQHPGDRAYFYGNTRYERIPASEMLLAFLPFRVGQCRGLPWAHAALLEMHHLYGYREAELTGARIAASKMFAYEPDSEVEPEDPDEEEPDFIEEVEPGMGIVVPYGYSMKELNWQHPGGNFGAFMKEGKRGAASGLDVSYNTLGNDAEGVSFSSLRQFVLEDRDSWKKKQRWMRQELCDRVMGLWLRMSLLGGSIPGLRFSDYDRLNSPRFQGRRWEWVDPLKDEKANTEAISNMTKSPLQIIRERGEDPETVINELLEFEEMVAKVRTLRGAGTKPKKEEDDGEQEEDDS
ncbi:phage portal protein [Vibrio anguillarum]|uniref:phage portal protein n=1 Tax=Vibrio anguillarum TaxID=55601 RepID=UPI00188B0EDF|nr:phage portal protein [Vibrio anguillarum]MBF4250516.1 phage portal protein [Vibrio anguillarum]